MAERLGFEIVVDDKGTATIKAFSREVEETGKKTKSTGEDADKAQGAWSRFFGGMSAGTSSVLKVTAALTGLTAGVAVVKSTAESMMGFEAALANAGTQGVESKQQLEGLRQQILALDPALGSSTELAKGLYTTLSSGVEPAKAVSFLGDAAALSKAGFADLDQVIVLLTKTMAQYGLGLEQTTKVSDLLINSVKFGNGTFQDFANNLPEVIPIARNLGISLEEVTGTAANLSKVFPNVSQAITGFRSMLNSIIQNMGEFRDAGIDVDKVIAEEGLTGVLRRLQEVTGGNAEALKKFIPDIEGNTAAVGLITRGLEKNIETWEQQKNSQGAAADAYAKNQATTQAALDRFLNTLDRFVQENAPGFLNGLTGIVNFLQQHFQPAVKTAGEVVDFLQLTWRNTVAAVNDALAVVVGGFIKFGQFINSVKEFFGLKPSTGMIEALQDIQTNLRETAASYRISTDDFIAQNTKQQQAILKTKQENEKALGTFREVGEEAKTSAATSAQAAENAAASVGGSYEKMTAIVKDATGKIREVTIEAFRQAGDGARNLPPEVNTALQQIGAKSEQELQRIAQAAVDNFEIVKDSSTQSKEHLKKVFLEDVWPKITEAFGTKIPATFKSMYSSIAGGAVEAGGKITSALTTGPVSSVGGLEQKGKTVAEILAGSYEHAGSRIGQAIRKAAGAAKLSFEQMEQDAEKSATAAQEAWDKFAKHRAQLGTGKGSGFGYYEGTEKDLNSLDLSQLFELQNDLLEEATGAFAGGPPGTRGLREYLREQLSNLAHYINRRKEAELEGNQEVTKVYEDESQKQTAIVEHHAQQAIGAHGGMRYKMTQDMEAITTAYGDFSRKGQAALQSLNAEASAVNTTLSQSLALMSSFGLSGGSATQPIPSAPAQQLHAFRAARQADPESDEGVSGLASRALSPFVAQNQELVVHMAQVGDDIRAALQDFSRSPVPVQVSPIPINVAFDPDSESLGDVILEQIREGFRTGKLDDTFKDAVLRVQK